MSTETSDVDGVPCRTSAYGSLQFGLDDFAALATARFGPDPQDWAFACPGCGDVASERDLVAGGLPGATAGTTCRRCYRDALTAWAGTWEIVTCRYELDGGRRVLRQSGREMTSALSAVVLRLFPLADRPSPMTGLAALGEAGQ